MAIKSVSLRVKCEFCRQAAPSDKGDRHGQGRAKKQSRIQETEEREDQDNCRSAKSKVRRMATELRFRQKEIVAGVGVRQPFSRVLDDRDCSAPADTSVAWNAR